MTSSGIEPLTFLLVELCLDHLRYRGTKTAYLFPIIYYNLHISSIRHRIRTENETVSLYITKINRSFAHDSILKRKMFVCWHTCVAANQIFP
jgi:hypothetical protein